MRRVGLANPRGTFRSAKWIVLLSAAWTVSCAESAQEDPHATKYHFAIPGNGNPGDSNGAFWHAGRYHLMFLYKRADGYAWGHASSPDMLSWQRHADAIGPGPKEPEGCYSGGAFVDDDGKAYLSYWMIRGAIGLGLASGEAPFETWEKVPENPIVRSTSWGWTKTLDAAGREVRYASADPSNIWKKDGRYYLVAGNLCLLDDNGRKPGSPEEMKGDCAYLFESEDLRKWTYRHPFYQRRVTESRATGWTDADEDCMCPSFLPLPTRCTAEAVNGFCRHVPVERAPFRLNAGESLRLRVYVDGPVIEVCANERQMITRRVWPEHAAQARRIRLVSVGGGACRAKVRAWDIQASGRDGCD